jgi:hypothetical protein
LDPPKSTCLHATCWHMGIYDQTPAQVGYRTCSLP